MNLAENLWGSELEPDGACVTGRSLAVRWRSSRWPSIADAPDVISRHQPFVGAARAVGLLPRPQIAPDGLFLRRNSLPEMSAICLTYLYW